MLSEHTARRIAQWLSSDIDGAGRREVQQLLDRGEEAELEDRFGRDMEFGTGGLRGVMAAGANRMNTYTVARASQGLALYMNQHKGGAASAAVIAYDSRHRSRDFARTTAEVLAANAIHVYLFRQLRPTPLLSFAVRHLGATAGIVITSSHNPKQYNGYKVYWEDGAQIVPPHDDGIIREVMKIESPQEIRRCDFRQAVARGQITMLGSDLDRAYLQAIRPLSLHGETIRRLAGQFGIVYTPLHGSGGTMVPKALRSWGFRNVLDVPSQARPDGRFPTVALPNPEDPAALAEAVKLARKRDADLVLASDPDCDRLGVAVRVGRGRFQRLTGNQVGALLADYLCREMRALGRMPDAPLIVTTIVTTDLIELIGEHYGVAVEETLTGFKWICERIRVNEERRERGQPWRQFIYGAEESYGYSVGTAARDKDAIVTACVCAEMAAHARAQRKTLVSLLDEIEMRHGAFQEGQDSIFHTGAQGPAIIARIMDSLRNDPPRRIGGVAVEAVGDVKSGRWTGVSESPRRAGPLGPIDLPKSDVLIFRLADGDNVIARPSGTEPKIKFYFNLSERRGVPFRSRVRLEKARQSVAAKMARIRKDFLRLVEKRSR